MGSGLYELLGWGVLDPPQLVIDDSKEDEWDKLAELESTRYDLGIRSSYECEPNYLVIPLAINLPFLQDYWELPPLPRATPRVDPRTAEAITLPPEVIQALAGFRGIDLAAVWGEAQRLYQEAGLVLPEAGAVVLSDWD